MKSKHRKLLFISILLFAALFPLINSIDFFQNDDWVYYEAVQRFLDGNFVLHPYLGPTFYTQGVIAAAFAKIFSLAKLPALTLAMAVLSFYIFTRILVDKFNLNVFKSVLLGFLVFFNPLGVYLMLGFMTGHYFLPILLLCFYLLLSFEEKEDRRYLILIYILSFIGLLSRQVAMTIPLSIGLYHLFSKKFRLASFSFAAFLGLYLFYYNVFPMTARMIEIPLQFHHLADFDYSFALTYGVLVILSAFLAPVVFSAINLKVKRKNVVLFSVVSVALFIGLNLLFKPQEISWGEFPYFENTFERTGFYPRGILGTKYQFRGNYDLYKYWDLGAKVLTSMLISAMLLSWKKLKNVFTFFGISYIGLLVITETFYDRYIFMLIPMLILFVLSLDIKLKKWHYILITGFAAFLMFLTYQFAMDFVQVNKYVWHRAERLAEEEGIERKMIQGSNAWKLSYRNPERNYTYNFTFDSQEVNEDYKNLYDLVEAKEIDYPLNLFINPKVYLYRLKN